MDLDLGLDLDWIVLYILFLIYGGGGGRLNWRLV